MSGKIIGYDLNEKYCQISYFDEGKKEPHTMESMGEHYQIPLVIGHKEEEWVIGKDAKRLSVVQNMDIAEDLFEKALCQEKVSLEGKSYDAVWLFAKFLEISLKSFENIEQIVFTVSKMNVDIGKILKSIGLRMGVPRNQVHIQDYKESFYNYMLYQPKELWQYEAALFHCDRSEVRAYMLRKLRTSSGKDSFVTVEKVAATEISELEEVYPVLNEDRAKDADACFKAFVQEIFEQRLVSSVFLVGQGFEDNWYPQSLKVLCNGRRAFVGNNLYSKGACYTAYRKVFSPTEGPTYLDETKMLDQICLKMRVNGVDRWTPIVSWGKCWYEADQQFEILLSDMEEIEIHIESLVGAELRVEKVPLDGLVKRNNYTLRLQVQVLFQDEKICKISFKDLGFGEFFPATDFYVEKEIHLGGSNGQYHPLS